ncbi:hypothetical protein PMG11_07705 [Penicillium brasilianum]|uniref:Peptide-N4-(N-acetyl-beta-glucosaminyl)asparagine amidase A n=2 Tax=Penicillium brasilianum TaxID=104259 RepID=A0A0F7TQU5_PENBI|nr:hypothetical protein PMG11_07705 [Penicillium brasilianum]
MIEKTPNSPSWSCAEILSLFPFPRLILPPLRHQQFSFRPSAAVRSLHLPSYQPAFSFSFSRHAKDFLSPAMSKDLAGIRQALERARNCEDGTVDPQTTAILEAAITELWTRIQADPDSYVLSSDEFALFNYFLERYRGSTVAQRAVARFWNNYQGSSPNAGAKK